MNREDKKATWLIVYVSDAAASSILQDEVKKLVGYTIEVESEENRFIWIGLFKTILLHFRLKKFGIVSMFDRVILTNSVWC